jgi:hypothetical protein
VCARQWLDYDGEAKEVLGWRVRVRDCPSSGIGNGHLTAMLFVCAASVKLWRIMREHSLAPERRHDEAAGVWR